MKQSKTFTGKIPDQVGYSNIGDGYNMPKHEIIKEQKKNGLQPLNAVWDKKTKKYKVVYLSLFFSLCLYSCFSATTHKYYYVHPVSQNMACLP